MTTAAELPRTSVAPRRRSSNGGSDYTDVVDMFRVLARLPVDSPAYRRQREAIVNRCLPLADHCAQRYMGRGEPRDDLTQIARLGLMNAVNRFNVEVGVEFLSFAIPTIMGEIKRYFRDSGWSVSVPRRLKERHQVIGAAIAELSQRHGRAPTATELSVELGIDRAEVVESLIAGSCYRSLSVDAARGGGDDDAPALADRLGQRDADMDHIENREALRPLLAALPERERMILQLRFFESLTQTQIAERLGISQMHVSRLLARTLTQLRDGLLT
jgi:RNA polymerase sigma-B factor